MIKKIISGGQTGADMGGLLAGRELGLETGGTAPPNFMTEAGPNLSLKDFGLVEGEKDPKTYPKRTKKNVQDSDGTLLLGNLSSPGSKLTARLCTELMKPCILNPEYWEIREWISKKSIQTLNVAGNRESKNPGIELATRELLWIALKSYIMNGDSREE